MAVGRRSGNAAGRRNPALSGSGEDWRLKTLPTLAGTVAIRSE